MMTWANKPEEYSDADIYPADLFSPREWEKAAKRAKNDEDDYQFWVRVSIVVGALIVAVALSTLYKG